MRYADALPKIRQFNHILVTGPQRSGTTIGARIIAYDLNFPGMDETMISTHSYDLAKARFATNKKLVIQAPGLSACCHRFPDDVLIVFMERNDDEIVKSQKRIGWGYMEFEYLMYLENFGYLEKETPISVFKKRMFLIQRKEIAHWIKLDYNSFCLHKFWLKPEDRIGFHAKQTALDG